MRKCMRCDKDYDEQDSKAANAHLECTIVLPHPIPSGVRYVNATIACAKGHTETVAVLPSAIEEFKGSTLRCWRCFSEASPEQCAKEVAGTPTQWPARVRS